ncbi:MAG TPA: DUF3553 domain-containing protein [Phycisphaerales bacterium]|nr:DUF3553 domain-containing protein [Phycisphaerales bacterium]
MPAHQWSFGDRVVHAKRPEWGAGVVTAAQSIVDDGAPAQRLTIRFDRGGLKTLSTSHAELEPAAARPALGEQAPDQADPRTDAGPGGPDPKAAEAVLTRVPEAASDPFVPLAERLRNTLALYRFTDAGGSLLDWAAAQSGLKDPLSRFNRHELELLFKKFAFARDEHLKKLVLDARRKDPAALGEALRAAPPGAQQALRRLDLLR